MGNNININWDNVRDLSRNTLENFTKFEESRQNIEKLVASIPECWEGVDSNAFQSNLGNYAKGLKNDTQYFEYLSNYFDNASKRIGGTVGIYDEKFGRFESATSDNRRSVR
jgi:uncharacterized protein YukE